MEAEFFHADGQVDRQTDRQTDVTKPVVALCNFTEAPKILIKFEALLYFCVNGVMNA
jgi:hypothetical protein